MPFSTLNASLCRKMRNYSSTYPCARTLLVCACMFTPAPTTRFDHRRMSAFMQQAAAAEGIVLPAGDIPSFASEEAAQAWILQQKERKAGEGPESDSTATTLLPQLVPTGDDSAGDSAPDGHRPPKGRRKSR